MGQIYGCHREQAADNAKRSDGAGKSFNRRYDMPRARHTLLRCCCGSRCWSRCLARRPFRRPATPAVILNDACQAFLRDQRFPEKDIINILIDGPRRENVPLRAPGVATAQLCYTASIKCRGQARALPQRCAEVAFGELQLPEPEVDEAAAVKNIGLTR